METNNVDPDQEQSNLDLHYLLKIQQMNFVVIEVLTLKAPRKNASENVVCWSRLLQIIA